MRCYQAVRLIHSKISSNMLFRVDDPTGGSCTQTPCARGFHATRTQTAAGRDSKHRLQRSSSEGSKCA